MSKAGPPREAGGTRPTLPSPGGPGRTTITLEEYNLRANSKSKSPRFCSLFRARDATTQLAVEKHLATLRAITDVKDEATVLNIADNDPTRLSAAHRLFYTEINIWDSDNSAHSSTSYRSSPAQIAVVVRFLERLLPSNPYLSLLFGSHNQKTAHSKSDVDIIYLLHDVVDNKLLEKWLMDVGQRLKKAKEGSVYAVIK